MAGRQKTIACGSCLAKSDGERCRSYWPQKSASGAKKRGDDFPKHNGNFRQKVFVFLKPPRDHHFGQREFNHQAKEWVNRMETIYFPILFLEQWRFYLGDPVKHWETGFSAKSLAHCWFEAQGFPQSVKKPPN